MPSSNKVCITGCLTRDPEIKFVGEKSTPVCNFSIAINKKIGEKESVTFVECQCWNKLAEDVAAVCRKGGYVSVDGELKQDNWMDKETGKQRSRLTVNAWIVSTPVYVRDDSAPARQAPAKLPNRAAVPIRKAAPVTSVVDEEDAPPY